MFQIYWPYADGNYPVLGEDGSSYAVAPTGAFPEGFTPLEFPSRDAALEFINGAGAPGWNLDEVLVTEVERNAALVTCLLCDAQHDGTYSDLGWMACPNCGGI